MIDRIRIMNFKCLKDVTVELERLTVLVGPNGCGKSSVLQAMLYACHGPALEPQAWRAIASTPSESAPIGVWEVSGDFTLAWKIEFRKRESPDEPPEGTPRCDWSLQSRGSSPGALPAVWQEHPEAKRIFSAALLHPDAAKLCQASPSLAGKAQSLGPDGEGLAALLAYVAGYDADAFASISRDLGTVVPGVSRVRVAPAEVESTELEVHVLNGQEVRQPVTRTLPGHGFLLEFSDGRRVPSTLVSEGTAIALAILTLLHTPERPSLILLDDIDHGLHIEAQAKLVNVLRALLERHSDLQIVCTTHSPYLLDRFEPSEVRVLALDEARNTHVRKLTEHPELEKWKFGTQTGELWAALGDAWVTAPEPKP
jgi:predicted ATPase